MYPTVPVALLGWLPATLYIFYVLQPQRALLWSLVGGWLVLPFATFSLPGVPEFDKVFITCLAPMAATALYETWRITAFRPAWYDLPMIVWCLAPLASSLSNGLGLYDGLATSFRQTVLWGSPYLLGRVYFTNWQELHTLAVAIGAAGMAYVIPCLIEVRLSPQLHLWIYGITRSWGGTRYQGYRPAIFMQNGLELGLWMTSATLIVICLWAGRSTGRIWRIPISVAAVCILVTTVLCKSTGALALLGIGLMVFFVSRKFKSAVPLILLASVLPLYAVTRSSGMWEGEAQVEWLSQNFNAERAYSLEFRLRNEDVLARKGLERPIFGWGGWGRARVYDDDGRDLTTTDGLWIIALGNHGIVGLSALLGIFIAPAMLFAWHWTALKLDHWKLCGGTGLLIMVLLYGIDNLLNAMVNPVYVLAVGALISVIPTSVDRGGIPAVSEITAQQVKRALFIARHKNGRLS